MEFNVIIYVVLMTILIDFVTNVIIVKILREFILLGKSIINNREVDEIAKVRIFDKWK